MFLAGFQRLSVLFLSDVLWSGPGRGGRWRGWEMVCAIRTYNRPIRGGPCLRIVRVFDDGVRWRGSRALRILRCGMPIARKRVLRVVREGRLRCGFLSAAARCSLQDSPFRGFCHEREPYSVFQRFALEIVVISGALMLMCAQRLPRLIRDGPIGVRVREIRCRVC